MNRLVACLGLAVAVLASPMLGMGAQPKSSQFSLGGPTPIGNLQADDLPMPPPLASEPSLVPPQPGEQYSTRKPELTPVPEIQYNGPVGQLPVASVPTIELYQCVKYRDTRKIAPCATPIVVAVPDPCSLRDRSCCGPRPCVYVEICVPSCGCPTVCVTRHGNKTRYDYGKYAVDIVTLPNKIVVDYDF